jgi:hypothetical protein
VSRERDVVLAVPERLARGDPQLLAHDVDAGDLFGDWMFHLKASVRLEEEEFPGHVVDDELHRAGGCVADRLGEPERRGPHGGPPGRVGDR